MKTSLLCFDKKKSTADVQYTPLAGNKKKINFMRSYLRCLKEKPLSNILNITKKGKKTLNLISVFAVM